MEFWELIHLIYGRGSLPPSMGRIAGGGVLKLVGGRMGVGYGVV